MKQISSTITLHCELSKNESFMKQLCAKYNNSRTDSSLVLAPSATKTLVRTKTKSLILSRSTDANITPFFDAIKTLTNELVDSSLTALKNILKL